MYRIILLTFFIFLNLSLSAQPTSTISGTVFDQKTQEPLYGVVIQFKGEETYQAITDLEGKFTIQCAVGRYQYSTTYLGYKSITSFNLVLTSGNAQIIEIGLERTNVALEGVSIIASQSVRATDRITPLSTQNLSSEEIKANPGGNFDVSKVIQVLPGVAGGTTANRNDIIIRGGAPSENVYYLDDIEIPILNHFQTQGASGGATGILNVAFISDVQLTSSAFDSKYDNALASTFNIYQRNGNADRLSGNIRLSGSELALMLEGPLSQKTTFLASARKSYLKYLFQILDLPIRPDFWDFQYKINHKFNSKTELNLIGLGAIDHFQLAVPQNSTPNNEYIIRSNPLIDQWNYTIGGAIKRLFMNGYMTFALSRNMMNNQAIRYANNATPEGNPLLNYKSQEIENKLRWNIHHTIKDWTIHYGISAQFVKYNLDLLNTLRPEIQDGSGNVIQEKIILQQNSHIDFEKFGIYLHTTKYILNEKLLISGGLRSDINTFTQKGLDPFKTISPRISLSYRINDQWNIAGSVGNYFKLPEYTVLGFKKADQILANRSLDYLQSIHYTLGTQFIPRNDFRFTFEAFYKKYQQYPVSINDGISIANIGTDFSAVGNDEYVSTGLGRVYGIEAYIQQKLVKNIFYVVSATLYHSEFSGLDGIYKPSTWDYGYVISSTLGYYFKKNWSVGLKYRIAGGQPYTPFDVIASTAQYLTTGKGVLDYDQLNSKRLPLFQQLDLRIDKQFNFKNISLTAFVDFQNVFLYKTPYLPNFTFERNSSNTDFQTTDHQPIQLDGSNAIPLILNDRKATIVPAIGFIFEF